MQDFRTAVREAVRDEAALRGALAEADIAPMLMVLVQLTGDLDFLEEVAPHIHGPWSFLQWRCCRDRSAGCLGVG